MLNITETVEGAIAKAIAISPPKIAITVFIAVSYTHLTLPTNREV